MSLDCFPQVSRESQTQGSLTLTFNANPLSSKTIMPDIEMRVAYYNLTLTCPVYQTREINNITVSSTTITELGIGTWRITVKACNTAGITIGEGNSAAGKDFTFGSSLPVGAYFLTVRVWLGEIISSKTISFNVAERITTSTVFTVYMDGDTDLESAVIDDTSSDRLYMAEVRDALTGKDPDVAAFDACLMGMVEVAYELRNTADILVASEESVPNDGMDYVGLLSAYKDSDLSMDALSRIIVGTYGNFYAAHSATMAAIDLSQIDNLATAVNTFSTALLNVNQETINTAISNSQRFDVAAFKDLYDFANQFTITGAAEVKTAIDNAVLYNWCSPQYRAHGLAIYLPADSISADSYEPDNTYSTAQWIIPGQAQNHTIHNSTDNDYMKFTAESGRSYTMKTF